MKTVDFSETTVACNVKVGRCSNYGPGMTLIYFMARSFFCKLGLYIGKFNNDGLL